MDDENEGETLVCEVCGHGAGHRRHRCRDLRHGTGEWFVYAECAACATLWLPSPPEDLGRYYSASYYSFAPPKTRPPSRWTRMRRRAILRQLLGQTNLLGRLLARPHHRESDIVQWCSRAGVKTSDRILDVGCGNGLLLRRMGELGFTNLEGADPFVDADIALPEGGRIRKIDLFGLDAAPGSYDFIMLHHAFEHMPRPAAALARIRALLAPGRFALIRIPVADSWAWEHYGPNWFSLQAPCHLFLHTAKGMGLLAAKAGLAIRDSWRESAPKHVVHSAWYARRGESDPFDADPFERLSPGEIAECLRLADEAHARGRGDAAAFLLSPGDAAP